MFLLKYHVVKCIYCGSIQCSYSIIRAKCKKCGRAWRLTQKGVKIGVLSTWHRPQDASEDCKRLKKVQK